MAGADRWTSCLGETPVAPSPGLSGATAENSKDTGGWPSCCAAQPRSVCSTQSPKGRGQRQVSEGARFCYRSDRFKHRMTSLSGLEKHTP